MSLFHYLRRRAAVEETRAEAQLDLRDGLLEARADRIDELERQLARALAELATYKTKDFMRQALRLRRRLAEEKTDIQPAPGRHQAPEVLTELHPRISRGPLK